MEWCLFFLGVSAGVVLTNIVLSIVALRLTKAKEHKYSSPS